jgi:hypothetical protein
MHCEGTTQHQTTNHLLTERVLFCLAITFAILSVSFLELLLALGGFGLFSIFIAIVRKDERNDGAGAMLNDWGIR